MKRLQRRILGRVGLIATMAVLASTASARAGESLSIAEARQAIVDGVAEAARLGAPGGAIAVVDAGGHPLALERLDGTFAAAGTISFGKARTAALFGRPTRGMENAINDGRTALTAIVHEVDAVPLQGGVPLLKAGRLVGAVGVSGAASAAQDDEIATAVATVFERRFAAAPAAVRHVDGDAVRAAFAQGAPLVETSGYKVHASRRDAPGEAEIHQTDTDVFYVLSGAATFVTGGTVPDAKPTAPHELRGAAIEGGEVRALRAGDVVTVPAGVPHWFRAVAEPMTYYVVKVGGR
jgi:glc operon protein GlcG